MTERNKTKSVDKSTKNGKRSKRHRTNSKNAKSPSSSSKKHSTSSTMNSKASPKTRKKTRNSSVSTDLAATSGSDSMAYDSTTDISLQTLSIESDDRSSAAQSTCHHPADDGKESSINDETLRWNSFCDDPAKEAKRLEIYKANRRHRYYELAKARAVGSRYYAQVENTGH